MQMQTVVYLHAHLWGRCPCTGPGFNVLSGNGRGCRRRCRGSAHSTTTKFAIFASAQWATTGRRSLSYCKNQCLLCNTIQSNTETKPKRKLQQIKNNRVFSLFTIFQDSFNQNLLSSTMSSLTDTERAEQKKAVLKIAQGYANK
jgi:hypothetical protein